MRSLLLACCLLASLSASAGTPAQPQAYPAEVRYVEESANFPLSVAGYKRGRFVMYAPNMADYSIGYNLNDASLLTAATLYFYSGAADLSAQFESEKRQIFNAHPDAALLSEGSTTFDKDGKSFPARVATFRFDGEMAQKQQTLFSEIILVQLPIKYFKVRSTAPFALAKRAQPKVRELLGAVNWLSGRL